MEERFLLPCPFCGFEKPQLTVNNNNYTISVVCACGANSKPVLLEIKENIRIAVDFWNMRSNPFLLNSKNELED